MEQQKKQSRIVNKTKAGCTVMIGGNPRKMSWELFDKLFVLSEDGKHAQFKEGLETVVSKAREANRLQKMTEERDIVLGRASQSNCEALLRNIYRLKTLEAKNAIIWFTAKKSYSSFKPKQQKTTTLGDICPGLKELIKEH